MLIVFNMKISVKVCDSIRKERFLYRKYTDLVENKELFCRKQPHGTARKSHSTITRSQEDKLSKATSSLFPIKMIAILEWTYSNIHQNIVQLQTPTMGVTNHQII